MPDAYAQPLVLLVDDYDDARELYGTYLAIHGYRVEEASDGHGAVEKALRLLPDIILMDLSLPGIDGWDVTSRLKRDDRTAHIPIIAFTAHALPKEIARALAVGCDAIITKPCLPEVLVKEIVRVLGARTGTGPRRGP